MVTDYFILTPQRGADTSLTNDCGMNALMVSASCGRALNLDILLQHESPLDCISSSGRTALMMAVLNDHVECVEILLAYGANMTMKDAVGRTVRDIAVQRGNEEIISLIEDEMKKGNFFI